MIEVLNSNILNFVNYLNNKVLFFGIYLTSARSANHFHVHYMIKLGQEAQSPLVLQSMGIVKVEKS